MVRVLRKRGETGRIACRDVARYVSKIRICCHWDVARNVSTDKCRRWKLLRLCMIWRHINRLYACNTSYRLITRVLPLVGNAIFLIFFIWKPQISRITLIVNEIKMMKKCKLSLINCCTVLLPRIALRLYGAKWCLTSSRSRSCGELRFLMTRHYRCHGFSSDWLPKKQLPPDCLHRHFDRLNGLKISLLSLSKHCIFYVN